MNQPTKAVFAIAAAVLLANCSGTQDTTELPVRDGPQNVAPFTLAAPAVVDVVAIDG